MTQATSLYLHRSLRPFAQASREAGLEERTLDLRQHIHSRLVRHLALPYRASMIERLEAEKRACPLRKLLEQAQ